MIPNRQKRGIAVRLVVIGLLAVTLPVRAPAAEISHGPMLGNVTARSVRVWARTDRPGEFRVRYSEKSDWRGARVSAAVATAAIRDNTGWTELTDLKPDTLYHYAVVAGGGDAPLRPGHTGTFRTLPDAEAFRDPRLNPQGRFNFSFEVGSCNRQTNTPGAPGDTVYATMLARLKHRIHFHILNGDWIYEESATPPFRGQKARETSAGEWAAANGLGGPPPAVQLMDGIAGVWANYKLYLARGGHMARFHREMPLFVMFDDHEIYNDIVGAGEVGLRTDARSPNLRRNPYELAAAEGAGGGAVTLRPFRRTREAEVERSVFRDPALQAWRDYLGWANPESGVRQPIHFGEGEFTAGSDRLVDPRADFTSLDLAKAATLHVHWAQGNSGVYAVERIVDRHTLQIRPAAATAERARYSIGTNHYTRFRVGNCEFFLVDTRSFRTLHDRSRPHDARTSILGRRQFEWLADGLRRSEADFVFIVSSVSVAIPHDNKAKLTLDSKDESWTSHAAERDELLKVCDELGKPVFFLTGDIHNSFAIQLGPRVWEFLSGAHMSGSHAISDMEDVPLSGPFNSRGRPVTVRWGTGVLDGAPRQPHPKYCVVQINNVFNSPDAGGRARWVAYPVPQAVFQFHDGLTGDLLYAEAVPAR